VLKRATLVLVAVWISGCASEKVAEKPEWVTPERWPKEENPCYPQDYLPGKKCLPIVRIRL